jgi:pre-mRNA-processing factor 19
MASCASDGVKLWDLRKLRNFKSLAPYEAAPTTGVAFDFSGLYLAVGGAGGCPPPLLRALFVCGCCCC